MLDAVARLIIAVPRRVLAVAALITLLCAGFGSTALAHLRSGGQFDPSSESSRVADLLGRHFDQGDMNLTFLVRTPEGVAAAEPAGRRLVDELRASAHVASVVSPWSPAAVASPSATGEPSASPASGGEATRTGAAPSAMAKTLTSKDGKSALVVVAIGGGEEEALRSARALAERVSGTRDGLTVLSGGFAALYNQINDQSGKDLLIMEAIAVPLSAIALIAVFGGIYAALLPLVVGGIAVAGTLAELRLLTMLTDVSVYAMNLTTSMALALGIDYSLLLVSRYREEVVRLGDRREALIVAVRRAGRTVLFSSVTVLLAVSTLAVFPMYFLRSMAYAGIGVVFAAAVSAIVVAPALIVLLGDRIESLTLFRRKPNADPTQNFWHRSATRVMRRPVVCLVGGVAVLLVLGSPFLHARFGTVGDQILPKSAQARQVGDTVRSQFALDADSMTTIVFPVVDGATDQEVAAYADELSRVAGVDGVNAPDGAHTAGSLTGPPFFGTGRKDGYVWLTVAPSPSIVSFSDTARDQLRALRAVEPPHGAQAQFGGLEPMNEDAVAAVVDDLPLVVGLIVLSTFILLFLLTGSVVMPVKSLVLNFLSLTASLGATVWIFQDGHLGALGTTPTGVLVLNTLIFMAILAFGLSMDYEVFIVSRVREHWLSSARGKGDNERSVALGVATSGRVVTAAALLMCVVFAALCSAQIAFMRMSGLFLVISIAMDATLVRMVLVPAFMKLAGRWNWWAPKPLVSLHEKIGLSEG